jgi:hypothetical protein
MVKIDILALWSKIKAVTKNSNKQKKKKKKEKRKKWGIELTFEFIFL